VFATSAGSTASDSGGAGRNGLFTGHLLNNIKTPGLEVSEVFRRTGAAVSQSSNRAQVPAIYNQFFGQAYLSSQTVNPSPAPVQPNPSPTPAPSPVVNPSPAPTPTPVQLVVEQPVSDNVLDGLGWIIVDGKSVTIKWYAGEASTLNIPDRIQNLPVTSIESISIQKNPGWSPMFDDFTNKLTSVTIPSSVTSIEFLAFNNCGRLTSITVDSGNLNYARVGGVLFDKNLRTLIAYPDGKQATTYIIPSSVTAITGFAFNNGYLTNVTIPSSVTSIELGAFSGQCQNLTSVILSRWTQVANNAFPSKTRITYSD
jgi:hypothetical protein